MSPREWNAASYERVSGPQEQWGRDVLDRLELDGDERVLDAGCGTGRVTAALLDRLPRGELIAVDGSAAMVEQAQERFGDRVHVFQADLVELELEQPVDAILSTATFHWIPDHDRLFERLHAALRPGGRLVAQCGGQGNVARLHRVANQLATEEPYAEHLSDWERPWHFAGAEETAERLDRAGFTDIRTSLEPYPITPEDPAAFLRTVCLGPHLGRLPEELHERYIDAVCERAGAELDYVRLNIDAKRRR